MAYNATYTAEDAAPIVFDLGGAILVGAGAFATILGFVFAYFVLKRVWAWGAKK